MRSRMVSIIVASTMACHACVGCNESTALPTQRTRPQLETVLHPDKGFNVVVEGVVEQLAVTTLAPGEPLQLKGRGDLGKKFVMYPTERKSSDGKDTPRPRSGYQVKDFVVEMPPGNPVNMTAMFFEIDANKKRTPHGQPAMPLTSVNSELRTFQFNGLIQAPTKAGNYELVLTLFEPPDKYNPYDRNDSRLGSPFPVWRHLVLVKDGEKR